MVQPPPEAAEAPAAAAMALSPSKADLVVYQHVVALQAGGLIEYETQKRER